MSLAPFCRDAGDSIANVFPHSTDFSCLFDGTSGYLQHTPPSAGNRKTHTFFLGFKPVANNEQQSLLSAGTSIDYIDIEWSSGSGKISVIWYQNSTLQMMYTDPVGLLLDQTGHCWLTIQIDTTKATNQVIIWLNGQNIQLTEIQTAAQNKDTPIGGTVPHTIGRRAWHASKYSASYHSCCLWAAGQALDYSAFIEPSNLVTGLWIPKSLSGLSLYSHLGFGDADNLGKDASGSNDWTVNGSPVQTTDTPTNNFAVLNRLAPLPTSTLSEGNLKFDGVTNSYENARTTLQIPKTGKFIAMFDLVSQGAASRMGFGLVREDYGDGTYIGSQDGSVAFWDAAPGVLSTANGAGNGILSATVAFIGSVGVVAYDADTGKVFCGIVENGNTSINWLNGANPETGENPAYTITDLDSKWHFACHGYNASDAVRLINGAQGFDVPTPTGYLPLSSANRPEPTILKSSTVVDVLLRDGTGASSSVSLPDMKGGPDVAIIKGRSVAYDWFVFDSQRGDNNVIRLNSTDGATDLADTLSFATDGYGFGNSGQVNANGHAFLDLLFKAGIDSGLQAITYTGNGIAGHTIPHSLGKIPTFIMVKDVDAPNSWYLYHAALGGTKYLKFDTSPAAVNSTLWNDTDPTSTHFTLGTATQVNASGRNYIAYIFTDSDIFKAFSYTGNGSTDGPFVNLGGKPLSIPFLKNTKLGTQWVNQDAVRSPCNPVNLYLQPNLSDAEASIANALNTTSQGFKVVNSGNNWNTSGDIHIGLAILESTQHSNAY